MTGPQSLPIFKPPYNPLSAYDTTHDHARHDMNTGERLGWIPIGQTPQAVSNHPMLRGKDLGDRRRQRVDPDGHREPPARYIASNRGDNSAKIVSVNSRIARSG